jgi:predicted methyltransferase
MNRNRWLSTALAASLCLTAVTAFAQTATDFAAAVSGPGRPADQVALDASRHPAEVLAFLGLKKGMTAADIMAGEGYYTAIMARVVGAKGKVMAYNPSQFVAGDAKNTAAWAALTAASPNISVAEYPFDGFAAAPDSYDFVLLHLVYHDLYWQSEKYKVPRTDPAAFLRTLYAATKPGGIVGVIDHVALPGDTRATVDKLHRIDPATVRADFLAAGFVLEAESPMLRVPGDDHSKLVFDPSVRGQTDRFVYRFRKPRHHAH